MPETLASLGNMKPALAISLYDLIDHMAGVAERAAGVEDAAAATEALPRSRIARSIFNLSPSAIPRSLRC
jgi:hypothetical protein